MPARRDLGLTGSLQLAPRIGLGRLEQAIGDPLLGRLDEDERLCRQLQDGLRGARLRRRIRRGYLHRCRQLEGGAEQAEAAEHQALVGREELEAPVQHRFDRFVARERAATKGEQRQASDQPAGQALQPDHRDRRRRQLERERQPVERPAYRRYLAGIFIGDYKSTRRRRRALREQRHRRVADDRLHRIRRGGHGQGLKMHLHFARHPQRLAAGRQQRHARAGLQQRLCGPGDGVDQVFAIVEQQDEVGFAQAFHQHGWHRVAAHRALERRRRRGGHMGKGRAVRQINKANNGVGTKLGQRRQCDARLADAARTDDRDEPMPRDAFHHFGDARLAADQAVDLNRQRKRVELRIHRHVCRFLACRLDGHVGAQPIAAARHVDDFDIVVCPGPQRAADGGDVHAQIVVLDEDVRPDPIGDFLHRDHLAGLLGKQRQNRERTRAQADADAAIQQLPPFRAKLERAEPDAPVAHDRLSSGRPTYVPPQKRQR